MNALFPPRYALGSAFWCVARDAEEAVGMLFRRHYTYQESRIRRQQAGGRFIGPGEYLLLITPDEDAVLAWRKFRDASGQKGVNCCIFRNESQILSSELILDGMELAWRKWPGERLYTYVNPRKIRSTNPGYCFQKAGWKRVGVTKRRKLVILAVEAVRDCQTVESAESTVLSTVLSAVGRQHEHPG